MPPPRALDSKTAEALAMEGNEPIAVHKRQAVTMEKSEMGRMPFHLDLAGGCRLIVILEGQQQHNGNPKQVVGYGMV